MRMPEEDTLGYEEHNRWLKTPDGIEATRISNAVYEIERSIMNLDYACLNAVYKFTFHHLAHINGERQDIENKKRKTAEQCEFDELRKVNHEKKKLFDYGLKNPRSAYQ